MRALTAEQIAALDAQPRPSCALNSCPKLAAPRLNYRRDGTYVTYHKWCHRHRWELYAGGIYVAEDDDWDA